MSYSRSYGLSPHIFVGSITPQGHMLPVLVGAARLAKAAVEYGAEVVVYDTSGLVDVSRGGWR